MYNFGEIGTEDHLTGVPIKRRTLYFILYLLQLRKIYKMKCDGDTKWTDKLQPAILASNTQTKKSTNYTPFYLMFGRNFDD